MHRLCREVRFAVNDEPPPPGWDAPNGYAAHPPLCGAGRYFSLQVIVRGPLDPRSNYLLNIRDIDRAVRERAVPLIERAIAAGRFGGGGAVITGLHAALRDAWDGAQLDTLCLALSPYLSIAIHAWEHPMIRLSQKFEFSAAHRLHNPELSDAQNRELFGKCNNPSGHGHNYELEVTVRGEPDSRGVVLPVPELQRIVLSAVIDRLDHRNLNVDVPEFRELIPSVENIARVIHGLLRDPIAHAGAQLASVKVWETPKTWCEYSE